MVAAEIFEKFSKLQGANYAGVEDFSDRLHFQVTVVLLAAFCTTVTFKTYFLSPVACYLPNEYGSQSGQENFVNNYCWTEGAFAVPLRDFYIDSRSLNPLAKYEQHRIGYYQWIPFVLGLQSMLFYLPRILWRLISYGSAGTDIHHLIRAANDAVTADGAKHKKLVTHVSKRLEQLLKRNKKLATCENSSRLVRIRQSLRSCFLVPSSSVGYWLVLMYLLVKLLYMLNALMQLWLMQVFIGMKANHSGLGLQLATDWAAGRSWQDTMLFPRVAACAIPFRKASGMAYVYSQCTLPINMINEKIYAFLWFWTILVAVVTGLTVPRWIFRLATDQWRLRFVHSYLRLSDKHRNVDKRDCRRFVRDFLRLDGIFLLRMISINSGDVVCTEVVANLMDSYVSSRYGQADAAYFNEKVDDKEEVMPPTLVKRRPTASEVTPMNTEEGLLD